jgi:hypothetical protein
MFPSVKAELTPIRPARFRTLCALPLLVFLRRDFGAQLLNPASLLGGTVLFGAIILFFGERHVPMLSPSATMLSLVILGFLFVWLTRGDGLVMCIVVSMPLCLMFLLRLGSWPIPWSSPATALTALLFGFAYLVGATVHVYRSLAPGQELTRHSRAAGKSWPIWTRCGRWFPSEWAIQAHAEPAVVILGGMLLLAFQNWFGLFLCYSAYCLYADTRDRRDVELGVVVATNDLVHTVPGRQAAINEVVAAIEQGNSTAPPHVVCPPTVNVRLHHPEAGAANV